MNIHEAGLDPRSALPVQPRQWGRPRAATRRLTILRLVSLLALAGAPLLGPPAAARGEEPSGLQLVASMEHVMTDAIAKCERSVVSIARVNPIETGSTPETASIRGPFGPQLLIEPEGFNVRPDSPSYVPHDFATGVIIDRTGLILTNFHVLVDKSDYYIRTVDHKTYKAQVKAADERSDLAVLKVVDAPDGTEFTPIKFGDASKLRKGQIVICLGNPYAIARDGEASASWGIVSNLSRKLTPAPTTSTLEKAEKTTLHNFGTLIQTDAKLNFGTSGGALINLQGEMVGLTTALAATSGYEQAAGYAIPVDPEFLRIIKEYLMEGREVEYGFLGVLPQDLQGSEIRAGLDGSRIASVSNNTPARRDGLMEGDIVTHINDVPIHDADGLRLRIGILPPSDKVSLTINRAGGKIVRQVTLSKSSPEIDRTKKIFTVKSPEWRGLRVDYSRAMPFSELNNVFNDIAVGVREVTDDSPAAKAGLRPPMLITNVGDTRVQSPQEFFKAVQDRKGPVTLGVVAGTGQTQMITVEPQ